MHKIRIVRRRGCPGARAASVIEDAGYNTFLLRTRGLYLDMLTDSVTIAMTDVQQGAMMVERDTNTSRSARLALLRLPDEVPRRLG